MKTDSLFYKLFQTIPEVLFELVGKSPYLASYYKFTAVELKELTKRTDGIFLPKRKGDPIYFVEVQFQKDDNFYWRLMQEVFVYLGQNHWRGDWQAIVFWARKSLDPGVPLPYRDLLEAGKLRSLYLDTIENTSNSIGLGMVCLAVEPEDNAKARVLSLERQIRQLPLPKRRDMLELLEQALAYKFPNLSPDEVKAMFTETELKKTRFYQDVYAEGRDDLAAKAIPRLLDMGLTIGQVAEILDLDEATVTKFADRANF